MPIKVEEQQEIQHINVPVKDEPDDEMTLEKCEDSDLGNNDWSDSASSDYGHAAVLEPNSHANLLEYLKVVGIFNPTPEVKKYKHNNNLSYHDDEGYVDCGVNRQSNHWCRFYRKADPQRAIGYRYLNCDKSIYYKNPDSSEYYIDSKMEWFKPPPEFIWKIEG